MLQLLQAVGEERLDMENARLLHSVVPVSRSLTDRAVSVMTRYFNMSQMSDENMRVSRLPITFSCTSE